MSDTGPQAADWLNRYLAPGRDNVLLVYLLYLCGFVPMIGPVVIIGAVVMAYLNRPQADPVSQAHYEYQIRQLWMGLLYFAVSFLLVFILIGVLGFIATAVWWIVRVIKGTTALGRGEPPADPKTWSW